MTEPISPDELTERDRLEIGALSEMTDEEYDRQVNAWVANTKDDGSGRRVFLSDDLVARTELALTRLIAETKARNTVAVGTSRAALTRNMYRLSMARQAARQIRDAIRRRADAERTGPRDVAYRVLKDVYPKAYLRAVRLLEEGKSRREVAEILRAEA